MATTASPFGLLPVNMIGGGPYQGGTLRRFDVKANVSTAIFNGQMVVLSTAGLPAGVTASPTAQNLAATSTQPNTPGMVGVMQGCEYISAEGQLLFKNYLPADIIDGGAKEVRIYVNDDPNVVFKIQGDQALGSFNSSNPTGAIGMNAAVKTFTGSTTTGKSNMVLDVGSNGGNLGATATLGFRIIGLVPGTESDTYPEFLVKYNVGVHSYNNSLGLA
tara:strand:+ start:1328 stop:1981 length:654 start_codon:yes stop_codon:yes gene_type:complete